MRAVKLLHSLLDKACQSIDKRILHTLFSASETLIFCKQLSIASLGRSLRRAAKVKHRIKCMDRLFGNSNLHQKRIIFYRSLANYFIKNMKNPVVIVDWSGLTPCGAYYFLSASLAINGRSITLYEETYPLSQYLSRKTHQSFLRKLQGLLPQNCKPIVVTDAGFRNPWFKLVLSMGWDYVGRVRNLTHYSDGNNTIWKPIKTLYAHATLKPHYVGRLFLSKVNPLFCHFYLMKQRSKGRIKKNLAGKKVRCSSSIKHSKGAKEPWLIVSSLSTECYSKFEIMNIYKKRMQIEETFRDLKNMRNGLGLRHCRSFSTERLNVALLIATLTLLLMWLYGIVAKRRCLHYSFQSNTNRKRQVLSYFSIGWQAYHEINIRFKKNELFSALLNIGSLTSEDISC